MFSDTISIYTDGSCSTSQRVGGWAAILFIGNDKKILTGFASDTTHQRMELESVIHALNYLKKNNLHDKNIMLFTDSQYVTGLPSRKEKLLKAGFKTKSENILSNADLLQQLFSLFDEMSITITKVKSHQKNSEHERLNSEADKICRKLVRDLAEKD